MIYSSLFILQSNGGVTQGEGGEGWGDGVMGADRSRMNDVIIEIKR